MKKIYTLILLTLISWTAQSQHKFGHLTIVSERNDAFYLYINGVQYNKTPLTLIRIEELTSAAYDIKVEYEKKSHQPVIYNQLRIADDEGYMQDVTYLLNPNRRGSNALMLHQVIPMEPMDYDLEKEALYIWGTPGRAYRNTSVTSRPGQFRTRRNDHRDSKRRQHEDDRRGNHHNDRDRNNNKCHLMSDKEFVDAIQTIKKTSFDDNKVNVSKTIANTNCLTADQVGQIMKEISFDKSRLEFAKYAYALCYDPQNYYKLINILSFSNSKQELTDYINAQPR